MGLLFYPSKNHSRLNRKDFCPEVFGGRVMVNPNYNISPLPEGVLAICDSGAFQDIDKNKRLSQEKALLRQLEFEKRVAPNDDWCFESIAIYDQMLGVDEQIVNGKKVKVRGDRDSSQGAIKETLASAEYYNRNRDLVRGRIMFVGQGIDSEQYIRECVIPMMDYMKHGDWFGFGGFCIIGRVPSLKPLFYRVFSEVLPLVKKCGVTRFHLLGVTVTDAVSHVSDIARQEGVVLSNDSSSIEVNSILGKVFLECQGKWKKLYGRAEKYKSYHPADLAHDNIAAYHRWCSQIYPPSYRPVQLPLF